MNKVIKSKKIISKIKNKKEGWRERDKAIASSHGDFLGEIIRIFVTHPSNVRNCNQMRGEKTKIVCLIEKIYSMLSWFFINCSWILSDFFQNNTKMTVLEENN
jgi:hypothetical protein